MKIYISTFLLCCCLFLFTSCFNNQKQEPETFALIDTDSVSQQESGKCACCSQDSVLSLVLNIPEIQTLAKYLYKQTKGKHGASSIIFSPDEDSDSYTVNVGLNGEERFETMYLFNVNKKTCIITVEDIVEGQTLSLEEWQKKEKENFEHLQTLSENKISDKWYGGYYIYVPTEETTTIRSSISYTFTIDKDGCQLETNPIHNPIRCNGTYNMEETENILTLIYSGDDQHCNDFKIKIENDTYYIQGVGDESTFNDWLKLKKMNPNEDN